MNVYDFTVKDINDEDVSLSKYKGKVLLIVNTATKCGFTPQYEGLEMLYHKYREEGLEVLNFPSNQFMNQAPGTNAEISEFCDLNFKTTYDIFGKVDVNGKNADPLFKHLKSKAPVELKGPDKKVGFISKAIMGNKIKWNFTKFLVDREGKVIKRFSSAFKPAEFEEYIKEAL